MAIRDELHFLDLSDLAPYKSIFPQSLENFKEKMANPYKPYKNNFIRQTRITQRPWLCSAVFPVHLYPFAR